MTFLTQNIEICIPDKKADQYSISSSIRHKVNLNNNKLSSQHHN
uniref:Uncharacterized protein n=1 Tax=Anguilla anguilla TaxID=7936 RepID=A0A0E9TS43_ANGAN